MEQEDGKYLVVTVLMCQCVFQSPIPCTCPTASSGPGGPRGGTDGAGPGRVEQHF